MLYLVVSLTIETVWKLLHKKKSKIWAKIDNIQTYKSSPIGCPSQGKTRQTMCM